MAQRKRFVKRAAPTWEAIFWEKDTDAYKDVCDWLLSASHRGESSNGGDPGYYLTAEEPPYVLFDDILGRTKMVEGQWLVKGDGSDEGEAGDYFYVIDNDEWTEIMKEAADEQAM